ncbi:MAG: phage protease [Aliiglaciecola sp.]
MKKNLLSTYIAYNLGAGHVTASLAAASSYAALSNENEDLPLGMAACSFEIDIEQPWQQILPASDFSAVDGRPHEVPGNKWKINNESGAALATKLNQNAHPIVFDYEHQTLLSKENGQPAPASAWPQEYEWRDDKGLFVKLKFTPKARGHVKDDEYRFYSPVLMYDKKTGAINNIHSVALTNDPGIKGMAAAAALKTDPVSKPQPESTMNEALALLFSLIGLDVDTTKDIDAAALKAKLESKSVSDKLAALKAKVESGNDQTTQIAALKAQLTEAEKASGVDPATSVPVETYNAVIEQLAALSANHESLTVDQVIKQAQDDGKFVTEAEVGYLKSLGNSNMAALKAVLDKRPTLAALKGETQTGNNQPDDKDKTGVAALTADQKQIADQLGIDHETYAKDLQNDK